MMEPYAEQAAGQLGVSPDTLIAQAALETGWGQHVPASGSGSSSLNLFGVKAGAGFRGEAVTALTTEYDGRGNNPTSMAQPFRAYASVQQGINDYVTLLQRNSLQRRRSAAATTCMPLAARSRAAGMPPTRTMSRNCRPPWPVSGPCAVQTATAPLKNPAPPPTTAPGEVS